MLGRDIGVSGRRAMRRRRARLRVSPLAVLTAAGLSTVAGGAATYAAMRAQGAAATRRIESAAIAAAVAAGVLPPGAEAAARDIPPPVGDGVFLPDGRRRADGDQAPAGAQILMLGDSTAVGYGCTTPEELPGVLLAKGVATRIGAPVRLWTGGVVGAVSADLAGQVERALHRGVDHGDRRPGTTVAVIVIGGNDVTEQVAPWRAANDLREAVRRLRAAGLAVVVATCPDFGVLAPIPQPLRMLVTRWSRSLAVLQVRAVIAAGGTPVAIHTVVSPEFRGRPELFFADGFHPSPAGYARAVAALMPAVTAALSAPFGAPDGGGPAGEATSASP